MDSNRTYVKPQSQGESPIQVLQLTYQGATMPYNFPTANDDLLSQLTILDKLFNTALSEKISSSHANDNAQPPTVIKFIKNFAEIIRDQWDELTSAQAKTSQVSAQQLRDAKHNALIGLLVSQCRLFELEVQNHVPFAGTLGADEAGILRLTILHILLPNASESERRDFLINEHIEPKTLQKYLTLLQKILTTMAEKNLIAEEQIPIFQEMQTRLSNYKLISQLPTFRVAPVTSSSPVLQVSAMKPEVADNLMEQDLAPSIVISPPAEFATAPASEIVNPPLSHLKPLVIDEPAIEPVVVQALIEQPTPSDTLSTDVIYAAEGTTLPDQSIPLFNDLTLEYLVVEMAKFYNRYQLNRAALDSQKVAAYFRSKTTTSRPSDILCTVYLAQLVQHCNLEISPKITSNELRIGLLGSLLLPILSIKGEYKGSWSNWLGLNSDPKASATYLSAVQILLQLDIDSDQIQHFDPDTFNVQQLIDCFTAFRAILELENLDFSTVTPIPAFQTITGVNIIAETLSKLKITLQLLQSKLPAVTSSLAVNDDVDQERQPTNFTM